ncbi:MAG: glucosaminidase domain-containing protein [Microthrixaceae bacterium]|nr:glucosaminidase domain-containing protein [Microthrixaceae bacterium]
MSIDELARYYVEEGAAEGVTGDVAFAQSIVETGYFAFSARVPPELNNFSGLGAVDGATRPRHSQMHAPVCELRSNICGRTPIPPLPRTVWLTPWWTPGFTW